MLFDGDSVRELLDPIADGAKPGTLVIDSTTTGPDASRQLAAEAGERGLRFVDAPVAGSLPPAKEGSLAIFAGGSDDDVAAARPLLELWGDPGKIRHSARPDRERAESRGEPLPRRRDGRGR